MSAYEVEGVVTAALQGSDQMGGFYVQSLTGDRGLFIANAEYNVSPGQHVRLLGDVAEVYSNTQLNDIQGMRDCGEQVVQAADLTNADEPRVLDYNVEYKSDAQLQRFYAPDAYRSSDHDPVVMSFALEPTQAKVEFEHAAK
ncbi:hypothetical protein Q4519_11730 [Motilimonas sp. 1_MG-2023]|uniref:hypothetical protein n=1 Tax=Motilimonas sp. 1_MG-2023 TaxID=3062672 RepID=UPI0026E2AA3A|nr:hypothetical protein [Motilimonas sp. 1_MG-2023]MDO6526353.1 hypothetical protein [Motilimonas sp. 1_MG-2023]